MSVTELKKYLQERGISASGYFKTSLVEITSAVEKMVLPVVQISKRRHHCFRRINNSWYANTRPIFPEDC